MADSAESLRSDALDALTRTRTKLNSAGALLKLRSAPQAERDRAGAAIIETGLAVQALRDAQLTAIATKLEADSEAIRKAIADLNKALEEFKAIKPVLDGLTSLLKVVARVVALV